MTYLAMPSLSENRAQRSRPNQSMLSARSWIHNGSVSSDDQPDASGASLLDNLPGFEYFWNRNQQISSTSKVRGLQNIGARRISSNGVDVSGDAARKRRLDARVRRPPLPLNYDDYDLMSVFRDCRLMLIRARCDTVRAPIFFSTAAR
jgi:hypothetical protein